MTNEHDYGAGAGLRPDERREHDGVCGTSWKCRQRRCRGRCQGDRSYCSVHYYRELGVRAAGTRFARYCISWWFTERGINTYPESDVVNAIFPLPAHTLREIADHVRYALQTNTARTQGDLAVLQERERLREKARERRQKQNLKNIFGKFKEAYEKGYGTLTPGPFPATVLLRNDWGAIAGDQYILNDRPIGTVVLRNNDGTVLVRISQEAGVE